MNVDTIESRALAIRDEVGPSSGALAIGESRALRYSLPELKQIGEIMYSSGMFKDIKSVQQAMVKLLAGAELGYGPFQSLRAFHVIDGKPVETSGEITARIKRSGKYRMETYFIDANGDRLDPERSKSAAVHGSVVVIHEKVDGKWFNLEPSVFTKDDAATAGLLGKDVWRKYLRNMLFSRAVTNAARLHCADIFGGPIYAPEELGVDIIVSEDGSEALAYDPPKQSVPRSVDGAPGASGSPTPPPRPEVAQGAASHLPPEPKRDPRQERMIEHLDALMLERDISAKLVHDLAWEMFPESFASRELVTPTDLTASQIKALGRELKARTEPTDNQE